MMRSVHSKQPSGLAIPSSRSKPNPNWSNCERIAIITRCLLQQDTASESALTVVDISRRAVNVRLDSQTTHFDLTSDGTRLATALESTLMLWEVPTGRLLTVAAFQEWRRTRSWRIPSHACEIFVERLRVDGGIEQWRSVRILIPPPTFVRSECLPAGATSTTGALTPGMVTSCQMERI
jgi:hypothetical protein